jgi:hypothetical protein
VLERGFDRVSSFDLRGDSVGTHGAEQHDVRQRHRRTCGHDDHGANDHLHRRAAHRFRIYDDSCARHDRCSRRGLR